jgi:hypothetical protein
MARVQAVFFDEAEEVDRVVLVVENPGEFAYASGSAAPEALAFPVTLTYTADEAAELFHRAGKVPGNDPDYTPSSQIYCTLLPIVDRLIEYGL